MDNRRRRIGFIGIGVLGKGLALALAAREYLVVGACSRSISSARWLAGRLSGLHVFTTAQELADACDLVFITTPDSVIGGVAASVNWREGQGVVHCGGSASMDILEYAGDRGALTGGFHPFQTFAGLDSPRDTIRRLEGVTFAVSGAGWVGQFLRDLALDHPGPIPPPLPRVGSIGLRRSGGIDSGGDGPLAGDGIHRSGSPGRVAAPGHRHS
jgi:predicted short-subunit dehydrogenase-like oxidoreductase (DUF2520 family)